MHPFDLRSALLARHAQHVVLIHFPIALFIVAVAFDFLSEWRQNRGLTTAVYYNLTAAAILAVPTLVTGLIAWQLQLEGKRPKGVLLLHLVLGFVSSGLIWLIWWLHFRVRHKPLGLPAYRFPIEVVGVAVVALTGHIGGFLSGVNSPG